MRIKYRPRDSRAGDDQASNLHNDTRGRLVTAQAESGGQVFSHHTPSASHLHTLQLVIHLLSQSSFIVTVVSVLETYRMY